MKCRKLETETGLQTRSCGSYLLLYCLNWCIGWNDIENSIAWKVYCLFILNTEVKRHQRNIYWKKIVSKFLQFYPCNKYFENANILKYWKILPLEFIPKLCNIGWKIFVKFMTLRKFKAKVWAIAGLSRNISGRCIFLWCSRHLNIEGRISQDILCGRPFWIYRNFRGSPIYIRRKGVERI